MNLEIEPDYTPSKEDIEKLRLELSMRVKMFKKVRRLNNNLK